MPINSRNSYANAAIRIADAVAKELRRHSNERKHRKRYQRQLPVDAQHDQQNSGQDEDVFENGDHAGGEHLVQRINISRDAGDQTAYRVFVIEANVHSLQMAKNLAAQVEHHHLPSPLHQVGLQILEQEAESDKANV